MAILTDESLRDPGAKRIAAIAHALGVALQLRPSRPEGLLGVARGIVAAAPRSRVVVNSRADIALLAGAHGVQLKESGLPVRDIRRTFPGLAVGVSRHDREGLERAEAEGADWAILGPVFPSPGKEDRALGLDGFERAVRGLSIPVWAVGGIEPANAASCLCAGATGVAAIRPFVDSANLERNLRAFLEVLEEGGA